MSRFRTCIFTLDEQPSPLKKTSETLKPERNVKNSHQKHTWTLFRILFSEPSRFEYVMHILEQNLKISFFDIG